MSAGAAAAFALPPPVFVSRVTRAPPYPPPDNAGGIQARAQPIVLCRLVTPAIANPVHLEYRPISETVGTVPSAFPGIARYSAAQYLIFAKIAIPLMRERDRPSPLLKPHAQRRPCPQRPGSFTELSGVGEVGPRGRTRSGHPRLCCQSTIIRQS